MSVAFFVSPKAKLVWKALFFFSLGVFALEAFFDLNPTKITVTGTTFSISYYVYLTAYDLVRYFPAGYAFLAVGAILFASSRYKIIPLALAGFVVAFYVEIIRSTALMNYYKNTYACHWVYTGPNTGYFCPLSNMVDGHPNIPLQGDATGFIAFIVAVAAFTLWRYSGSLIVALADMFQMASGVICIFELMIYAFEPAWYLQQVTYFADEIYLGRLTNEDLLIAGLIIFATAISMRFWLSRRHTPEKRIETPKQESMQ